MPPEEYEKIGGITDVLQINGKKMQCKRIYDDKNFTLHTYFVWYWDDPTMGDFYKRMIKQNKIRKKYELDYITKINSYAIKELKTGEVKPVKINF